MFFHRLDSMLDRAPTGFERSMRPLLDQFRRDLGGPPPAASAVSPDRAEALDLGFADGLAAIRAAAAAISETRGWAGTRRPCRGATRRARRLAQAGRAYCSLGAPRRRLLTLICEHDSRGRPLRGDQGSRRLRFAADALPPARGFWRLHARPPASSDKRCGIDSRGDLAVAGDGRR